MKNQTLKFSVFFSLFFIFQFCHKGEDNPQPRTSGPLKIYMRSSGNDTNSGLTFNEAVNSFSRVQEILYQLSPKTDIEVHINQGNYVQQTVVWTFTNGKKITFTPIDFSKDRPVFDGEGRETWFTLAVGTGVSTNLVFRYIRVKNYKLAVWLHGNRMDPKNGWNGSNHFYQMYFERIGNKYSVGKTYGVAVIDLVNSRNNSIRNCYFENIENLKPEEWSHLHAIYLAHYSSNNELTGNIFKNICGDPIRTRDESNFNRINSNSFFKTGKYAVISDWYCSAQNTDSPCTKPSGECPSIGNEFRNNKCEKSYLGQKIPYFQLFGDDNYCGKLARPRLSTSGNTNN